MNHLSTHRRLAAAVGVAAAAMLLAACGSSSSGGTSSSAAPSTSGSDSSAPAPTGIDVGTGTITPKNTDKIAYMVQAGKTFSYTSAQAQAAIDKGKELGVTVDVYYSDLDPAKELANFQQAFTSGKYGGLLVQSVTPQLCKTIEADAVKNGVLVGVVGNPLCDQATAVGEDLWSQGTMTYIGGQNGVDGITDLLNASAEKQSGPQKVLLILGIKGHPSSTAWEVAFKTFQETHPDWELSNTVYTDFTTPGAFSTVQNALQANKDVTVAYSLYIDVTAGAAKALEAQGLTDTVALYENGGGSKVSVELIGKGQIAGSLPVYPASLGSTGVQVMVDAFNGKQPAKFIPGDGNPDYATQGVISKDNAGSFTPQW
jgi:ribose transport system substrate-binding protein